MSGVSSRFSVAALPVRGLVTLLAIALAACGATGFQRAPNAPKYGPLPVGAKVRIAGSIDDLPSESQWIGTLHTVTKGDPASRVEAEQAFRTAAARYGCDAATALESRRREVRTTKKVRTIGANGATLVTDEVVVTPEHDWTAQCIRTPDAPGPTLATTAAKDEPPEPKAEPVRPKKRAADAKVEPKPRSETKSAEAKAADSRSAEPKAPEAKTPEPRAAESRTAEPRAEKSSAPPERPVAVERVMPAERPTAVEKAPPPVKTAPERPAAGADRPEPQPERPTAAERAAFAKEPPAREAPLKEAPVKEAPIKEAPAEKPLPVVTTDPADAKLGSEIARMFLQWSDAWVKGNVEKLCGSFEESVVFNLSANQPRVKIKQEMSSADACASLRDGELASYIRELGPAEVHSDVATLISELFRIHGGAFLGLDSDVQKRYAEAVVKARAGKKPLACTMYTVSPHGEGTYQVSLYCAGVTSFKVFVARGADNAWKVKTFSHVR